MAFTTRRATPSTPKLNSVSSLLLIEADLSLDSKVYKRNHRRTVSKDYASKSFDVMTFTPPREIKLTPGHIATPQNEQESEFVSRFSDDSDSDTSHDDPARLFGIFPLILGGRMDSKSPKMNQLSDFSSYYTITTNGDGDNNTTSSSTLSGSSSRCDSSITGTQTPNMIASRTSSSTISSFSDLSELANGSNNVVSVAATANNAVDLNLEEPTFDLNRKSLDYRTVYALAQEYAKSTSSPSTLVLPSLSSSQATNSSKKTNLINKRNSSGFARWIKTRIKSYQDPIDRSYHLRK
nr:putative protein [Melanopsichium pennsylvanicum 4]